MTMSLKLVGHVFDNIDESQDIYYIYDLLKLFVGLNLGSHGLQTLTPNQLVDFLTDILYFSYPLHEVVLIIIPHTYQHILLILKFGQVFRYLDGRCSLKINGDLNISSLMVCPSVILHYLAQGCIEFFLLSQVVIVEYVNPQVITLPSEISLLDQRSMWPLWVEIH